MQIHSVDTTEPAEAALSVATNNLPNLLRDASGLASALGGEFQTDRNRLDQLQQRLQEERCHLAVLGQFKRGKSTLINALLGAPVLPAAVVPLTSIPTFLHGGEELTARVIFETNKPEQRFAGSDADALAKFLDGFVTEDANPHNRLGVQQVEVTYPARVLREGLALIDTPGIGSTFRHNTEATLNFLPQCDAALFVVSADPPVTEVEIEFLKLVRGKLARVFFILNKVDYLDADERNTAVAFLQRMLQEQAGFESPTVFGASARHGLNARQAGDVDGWQHSGMAEIEHRIVQFLLTEKTDVLNQALCRQADDILAGIQSRLELTSRSLQLPLSDLDNRVRQFEQNLTHVEEQRIVFMERLSQEAKRLTKSIDEYTDKLLPKSFEFLHGIVHACEAREGAGWSEDSTRKAIAEAIPGFFEREFGAAYQVCDRVLREALLSHHKRADELIASVHRLVTKLFDLPFEPPPAEIVLAIDKPYWRTHQWRFPSLGSIPPSWIDRLLPQRLRHGRIRRRIMEQVDYLVTRNVGDLRSSLVENLEKSVQSFRTALEDRLQRAIQTTRTAIETARRRRIENASSITPEITRLQSAVASVQDLRQRLGTVQR
ncbi:MAG TPA: dynamin family protein [Verrucomicrobiae bacterium]|nr:dynamin family protein [Verrucomicrobiae bacterium]